MHAKRSASALGLSALTLCLLSGAAAAQDESNQRAPIVRIYSDNVAYVSSTYITPIVQVAEDAYVFAVSMDLDGQIKVLQPDFPGISVRLSAHKLLRLPNFFAGFMQAPEGALVSSAAYSGYNTYENNDVRGTAIALASRQPFNLERIETDGDWNISAIRQLIEYRSPAMAAQVLADYLGVKGEPIGRDYMRFAGGSNPYYYGNNAYSACDGYYGAGYYGYGYGSPYPFGQLAVLNRVVGLRKRGSIAHIVGFDICGMPIVVYGPSRIVSGFRPGVPAQRPRVDTARGVFPPSRVSHAEPRFPAARSSTPVQSAQRFAPGSRRAEPPQIGDVTITAPRGRRAEPREIMEQFHSQSGATVFLDRARMPVDGITPSRAEHAATGVQAAREYRPEPRVVAPTPVQAPERFRQSSPPPAPVVYERPAAPPPPPPAPRSNTTPPPKR